MAAFTTIATAAGLAMSAGSTAASFAQANKQKKLQKEAEREATEAFQAAEKELQKNFYEGLSVPKEPFEMARESLLSAGEQTLRAAQEGETRGVAAAAGRVNQAQQQGQRAIAGNMGAQMLALEQAARAEDSRLAGLRAELQGERATGAGQAALEARRNRAALMQKGFEGLGSTLKQGASVVPLLGGGNKGSFDPTDASFLETQKTFNPTLESMQLGLDTEGRFMAPVRVPTANLITTPPQGVIMNPIVPPQASGLIPTII